MTPNLIGVILLGVPAVLLGYLVLRRKPRPLFFFFLALLAVSLGYLYVTGATGDIAQAFLGGQFGIPAAAR